MPGVFVLALGFQLYYQLGHYSFLCLYQKKKDGSGQSPKPPVSIIIPARNEEENLRKFLPEILRQKYPDFEIIVVNDCSSDGTEAYLEKMAENNSPLRFLTIKEDIKYPHGKKFALTIGIKAAKNEILLFTDADCRPASERWIESVVEAYSPGNEIILGYGAYEKQKGFLNKLIRFDTFQTAVTYFSFAIKGQPYMGVGRNLSYHRSLFFRQKGFASHINLLSGDDDLFVKDASSKTNTGIVMQQESHTISIPKRTYSEWQIQKKRHLTTGPFYKSFIKFHLIMMPLSLIILYVSFAILLYLKVFPKMVLSLFALRFIIQFINFKKLTSLLNEKDLFWLSPFLELMVIFTGLQAHISNLFTKESKWK